MNSLSCGSRELCRSRAGSSRADFVGVEPRGGLTPSPSGSRRPSHVANSPIQHMIDEWMERPVPWIDVESLPPHILTSSSHGISRALELPGAGERHFFSVLFPWMHVTVRSPINMTLLELKKALFESLKKMAHPSFSMSTDDYLFRAFCETNDGPELTDLFNEEQALCKLDLTAPFPMLFLYEPEGFRNEKDIAKGIGQALGYQLLDLENRLTEELKACRVKLFREVEHTVATRGQGGYEHYAFPEDKIIHDDENCPKELMNKIESAKLHYKVFYRSRHSEERNTDPDCVCVDVDFHPNYTPYTLIENALKILEGDIHNIKIKDPREDFLLQLVGQKCFLTGKSKMVRNYGSVRSALEDYRTPMFVLRRKDIVLKDYPAPRIMHKPAYVRAGDAVNASDTVEDQTGGLTPSISLWNCDEMFSLRPISCSNMGAVESESRISVIFAVYCGKSEICRKISGKVHTNNPRWQDDFLTLDLYTKDMPPAAILCMSLVEEKASKKTKQMEENVIGYVNMRLVDWKDELLQGMQTFSLWPDDRKGTRSLMNPEGKVGQCDLKGAPRLMVEMACWNSRVRLPPVEKYLEFVETQMKWGKIDRRPDITHIQLSDMRVLQIQDILRKHLRGLILDASEENLVWNMRHFVAKHIPDALVVLAECDLTWQAREHFAELYVLLNEWEPLSIGAALILLGKRYIDRQVRKFAAEQLDMSLDTHSFPLFILPLVQALKCEPYSCSELALLLLRKALSDYRIGHKMFWILRAELADMRDDDGAVTDEFLRLALLIEAYLRGNEDHIRTVVRQVSMVDRLTDLSVMVKNFPKDIASKRLREELHIHLTHFEHMDSPLDPTNALGVLIVDECKVLGSAKVPLRLCWKNTNPLSRFHLPRYEIIFKNGDDLRQDMLVLQVLEVMDAIWKKNNLDCCLSPYPVLPMGTKIGMIGVVTNCSTIFEIQSEGGKIGTAVKSLETTFINKHLRDNAKSDAKVYLESVDRFQVSCVGYSVATFIMGIKDRHNDNIMMTKDGKLFHIDFGHILGHGKTKLGIQRDRVPFVLTEHFLCVIRKGRKVTAESHDVRKFQEHCVAAYLLLWDVRALFVSLFSVMQEMQLPELSTASDLDYLKGALCVEGMDREAATKHFNEIFEEAFNGSWSTKTNWFFHTVKHL